MNITRKLKIKELNGEFDNFSEKERFLINYFIGLRTEIEVCESKFSVNDNITLIYYYSEHDDLVFHSQVDYEFSFIAEHILYEFDNKFNKENSPRIYDVYLEVNKIYVDIDKKLNLFKLYSSNKKLPKIISDSFQYYANKYCQY